jgi:hypothetical protein
LGAVQCAESGKGDGAVVNTGRYCSHFNSRGASTSGTFGADFAVYIFKRIGRRHPSPHHPVGAVDHRRQGIDQRFYGFFVDKHQLRTGVALDRLCACRIQTVADAFRGRAQPGVGNEAGVLRHAQCHQQGQYGHADDQLDQAESVVVVQTP